MEQLYAECGTDQYTTTTAVLMTTFGVITTSLNSMQICYMRYRVKSQAISSLIPFLYSMAIADLMTGMLMFENYVFLKPQRIKMLDKLK